MINHSLKIIFIHIPKCAGTSVTEHFFGKPRLEWRKANYELLYGWCPVRKLHMQHATPMQLLDTKLIDVNVWNDYFKFSIIRNPWDRAYSDYLWIKKTTKVKGSFYDYINAKGDFHEILTLKHKKEYRGDHLTPQFKYLETFGVTPIDLVIKFDNLNTDLNLLSERFGLGKFNSRTNISKKRYDHYSKFYTGNRKRQVDRIYSKDITQFNFEYEEKKRGLYLFKNLL